MPSTSIDRPLAATLYELGLCSEDGSALAKFYGEALGYRFSATAAGLSGRARDRRLEIVPGTSRTLAYAAYAVPDLSEVERLAGRLAAASVVVEPIDKPGFGPGAIAFEDPDGNQFVFGVAQKAEMDLQGDGVAGRPARLQHVVFASQDVDRLLSFFTDTVGFVLSDRVLDETGGLRTAFVRCGNDHHSLAFFAASENRLDHHCYEAEEWNLIRDWADHFAAERMPLKWGPGRHGPGDNLFVFIHDPDGNWVEISAELEQVAPDRPAGDWPHEERTLNMWGVGLLRS